MLEEMRMIVKLIFLAVLKNEDTVGLEQLMSEYQVGNLRQLFEGIRRIGKDEVVLFVTSLDEAEHIFTERHTFLRLHLAHHLTDERMMRRLLLHADHTVAASRQEFETDASRSREQVESGDAVFEVHHIVQHIEQALFREVGRRAGLKGPRYIEMPMLVYSAYHSHNAKRLISSIFVSSKR
jgi:hypothetical protein